MFATETDGKTTILRIGHGKANALDLELLRGLVEQLDAFEASSGRALDAAFRRIYTVEKPIVGAINGHAIAGGCILTVACDHRVMRSGRGKVGVTELFVGVPFPALALEMMRGAVAPHAFEDLVLTGRLCDAEESRDIGLVHELADDAMFMERTLEVAAHLGSVLPETYALTKRQMRRPTLDRAAQFADHDKHVAERWRSDEVRATIREFLDATVGKGQS